MTAPTHTAVSASRLNRLNTPGENCGSPWRSRIQVPRRGVPALAHLEAVDSELTRRTSLEPTVTTTPEHALARMTSYELRNYRANLEDAINQLSEGDPQLPVYRDRLAEAQTEIDARARVGQVVGSPAHMH